MAADLDAPAPHQPDAAWVSALKEGDEVDVAETERRIYRATVSHWTPTFFVRVKHSPSDSGQLFTREGYIRGGGFFCRYLVPPSPAKA